MTNHAYEDLRTTDVDRSAWRSLVVFAEIAGKWWVSFWILALLSGTVSFSLTVTNIRQFSPSVWITLLILGLVVVPIVSFHFLRVERDKFKKLWDDKDHIISILSELEDFRAKAAKLQIEGMRFPGEKELDDWLQRVEDWRKSTHEKIYMLHPAEAGNFTTLGLFTPELATGTEILNPKHQQALLNLVRRIHILGEIRDRWTTRRG